MFRRFLENFRKPEDNFAGRLMLMSMNRGHEKLAKWGRSYIKINKEDAVLDLGCGGGRNIEYFFDSRSQSLRHGPLTDQCKHGE